MRITRIKVTKLFGVFDYDIYLKLEERITILIAPNGFGKTKILEMLHGLLSHNFTVLRRTPFEKYEVSFDNGQYIMVESINKVDGKTTIQLTFNGGNPISITREDYDEIPPNRLRLLEDFAPVKRIGVDKYRDLSVGDTIGILEIVERYREQIPEGLFGRHLNSEVDINLQQIQLKTRFIKTQRLNDPLLMRERRFAEKGIEIEDLFAVVRYQNRLKDEIQRILASSAEKSQALDSTFPRRLINQLNDVSIHANFNEQVSLLNELNDKRKEIAEVGLLDRQTEEDQIPSSANPIIANVLAVLVKDTEEKLAVFDDLLVKIKLFRDMINKRFQFKSMIISREKGYAFKNHLGYELPIEHLSSGEQHELVLLYELLFETISGSLVIIDEPELSLHIDWQREFLKDIQSIIKVSKFDVLIATHSPDIVQAEFQLLVDLGQMVTINE